jgi:hypothetical protein
MDARDKRGHGDGEVLDLIGTRSKARSRQVLRGINGFSEPVRRHIRHKHLSEQDYAFEKIFRRGNGR